MFDTGYGDEKHDQQQQQQQEHHDDKKNWVGEHKKELEVYVFDELWLD